MRPIQPRIYTHLVILWLALSVSGIVMGIVVWKRLNQSLDASFRGATFRITLQNVDRTLIEAESDARAYCLDGDLTHVRDFQGQEEEFSRRFVDLVALTSGHSEMRNDVEDLRTLAATRFQVLRHAMEDRRHNGPNSPVPEGFAESTSLSGRAHAIVGRLQQYPQDLFAVHSTATRNELQRALSTTLAAGLFGLGAGVLAFYLSRVALRQEKQKRELTEHALRAERAAQDKTTFLANMSHEIRTPMNAILGFSELLVAELPTGGRSRTQARSINDAAQSLLQLINDILDLSKIEASMLELHPEPADVRELSAFIQTVFSQQATKKNLKLECAIAPDLPHTLLVDRTRLRQILINLVGNAVKFTERGSVTVRTLWRWNVESRNTGTLIFEVQDTGVGIPKEKQEQIFEPFVQVDTSRPVEQQGTGLGLSIVMRLAERMNGGVEVESEIGRGSIFRIRLNDVTISSRSAPPNLSSADEVIDFNDLAAADVLVVDDNAVNRDLLGSIFDGTHHRVRFATNGREAIEQVRVRRPDIVLMDIRMPEMDGQTALTEIRKLAGCETLPVIAVTASSMVEDEHHLRGIFAGYLRKPFTRSMLFRQIGSFLPRRASAPLARMESTATPAIAATPAQWPELLSTLKRMERNDWPRVRDGGAITETKDFAHQLFTLGKARGCPRVCDYAQTLLSAAESYSIHKTEAQLEQFPELTKNIETEIAAGRSAPVTA
jgi:signal transduction histidine kinase/DNA-binding NarL/FixJ family response regulator